MSTLNTEQAKVNGAQVTGKEVLDELLEKVDLERAGEEASFRLIDIELSNEIVGTLRGHFAKNLIYNMPRKSEKGKTSCVECDLLDGDCWYKQNNIKHIHILGVGIQGALTAMRAYGRLEAVVEQMPEIVEQGDKLYWAAYAEATDGHTSNSYGRWYLQSVMMKSGNKFIENEFGASIAQSKALRNVILALIPAKLMEQWIEDYRTGKQAFTAERARQMGYGPEKAKPDSNKGTGRQKSNRKSEKSVKKEEKRSGKSSGERDLALITKELATTIKVDASLLEKFGQEKYDTPGQNMLNFNRSLNDEVTRETLKTEFSAWEATQKDAAVDGEYASESTLATDDGSEIPLQPADAIQGELDAALRDKQELVVKLLANSPLKDVDTPGFNTWWKNLMPEEADKSFIELNALALDVIIGSIEEREDTDADNAADDDSALF